MLLEFGGRNFKSLRGVFSFDLRPYENEHDRDDSIITLKSAAGDEAEALSAVVVYGPNAAGKSNLLDSLKLMRCLVGRGRIADISPLSSQAGAPLPLNITPHLGSQPHEGQELRVEFLDQGRHYRYSVEFDLGGFLSASGAEVVREELHCDGRILFARNKNQLELAEHYRGQHTSDLLKNLSTNLQVQDLFLVHGFSAAVDSKCAAAVQDYVQQQLMFCDHLTVQRGPGAGPAGSYALPDHLLGEAARKLGSEARRISWQKTKVEGEEFYIPCSSVSVGENEGERLVPSEAFESAGTLKFVLLYGQVKAALERGAALIIDELDTSLHPQVVTELVRIFHSRELNPQGAQLIFNTHNPLFLRNGIFRRDEIRFVARDAHGCSELYALADFRHSGDSTENYLDEYFRGRYGANVDLDLTQLLAVPGSRPDDVISSRQDKLRMAPVGVLK